jgi:hypothetical protein
MAFAVIPGGLGVCTRIDDGVVLWWHYGSERVEREQLQIVSHKPTIVSNGDDLGRPSVIAVLYVVGWLGGSFAIMAVLGGLLPRRCRMALNEESDPAYENSPEELGGAAAISCVVLFALNALTATWIAPILAYAVASASSRSGGSSAGPLPVRPTGTRPRHRSADCARRCGSATSAAATRG